MFYRLVRTSDDSIIAILRLMLGVLFVVHGSQKMLGLFGGPGFAEALRSFEVIGIPRTLGVLTICAEFFGGIALAVGCLGRIAALGIITNMAVAITLVHRQFGLFMNWDGTRAGEGFEFHLLVIAMALAIVVRGSGAFSLDLTLTNTQAPRLILERPRMAA